jgi:DNA primase
LIERPALLRVLAEDVSHLPIANPELERLLRGLLDALSHLPEGIDPAADSAASEPGGTPLEVRLIADHLQRNGLGALADTARAKARDLFRDDPREVDGWVAQWRRTAQYLTHRQAADEELQAARERMENEMTEESVKAFNEVVDKRSRERLESAG